MDIKQMSRYEANKAPFYHRHNLETYISTTKKYFNSGEVYIIHALTYYNPDKAVKASIN